MTDEEEIVYLDSIVEQWPEWKQEYESLILNTDEE